MIRDVHSLRSYRDFKVIDFLSWINETENPSYSLNKPHSGVTFSLPEELLREGHFSKEIDKMVNYGVFKKELM